MPATAKILCVQVNPNKREGEREFAQPVLYALVDQGADLAYRITADAYHANMPKPALRTFEVVMTGDDRPYLKAERFVGSYLDGSHVLHIFEVS